MQVDRQETSFFTPVSLHRTMMLSCMWMFLRQNSTLYFWGSQAHKHVFNHLVIAVYVASLAQLQGHLKESMIQDGRDLHIDLTMLAKRPPTKAARWMT